MPDKVLLAKHVVAVRSARDKHWLAALTERTLHTERLMGMLYDTLASADYTDRVRFEIDSDKLAGPEGYAS